MSHGVRRGPAPPPGGWAAQPSPILDSRWPEAHNRGGGRVSFGHGGCAGESRDVGFHFFDDPVAELIVWGAIGALGIAVGAYVIGKIRAEPAQKEPDASEWMSKFRELHSKGVLSDAEFRTIKTKLAARLQEELKDNGETG